MIVAVDEWWFGFAVQPAGSSQQYRYALEIVRQPKQMRTVITGKRPGAVALPVIPVDGNAHGGLPPAEAK